MLKQFIPSDFCLKCLGCCRFAQAETIWAPSKFKLILVNGCYLCPKLDLQANHCKIYLSRPFDCRLYPFLLVKRAGDLYLGLHTACLFVETARIEAGKLNEYADYLKKKFSKHFLLDALKKNPRIAADYDEHVQLLFVLEGPSLRAPLETPFLTGREPPIPPLADPAIGGKAARSNLVFKNEIASSPAQSIAPRNDATTDIVFKKLTISDKPLVDKYLKKQVHEISAYHFANIFIWKEFFGIFYAVIDGCLCLFYRDKIGMFMALPPLGEVTSEIIQRCFAVMRRRNQNSEVSRIENVSERDLNLYKGFAAKLKDKEYVCLRKDLVNLAGDKFRHKRAGYNYFVKNYKAEGQFIEYQPRVLKGCLALYKDWLDSRKAESRDVIYNQMLEDSASSFKAALENYKRLGLIGYVVEVECKIKACTVGYSINNETFCVLFEVCELSLKGLPQFTFRELCKKMSRYKYINVMGASDLENLRKVKLSYRPAKEVSVYNIYKA